jgi:hypothetical protein
MREERSVNPLSRCDGIPTLLECYRNLVGAYDLNLYNN